MIFEAIAGKFQFKFKNRTSAAGILTEALKDKINTEERKNAVVLAIPRGGVITGDIVATKLSCRLGIIIPRKLADPGLIYSLQYSLHYEMTLVVCY
jgi:predicted phosphoribosyltransferase